MTEPNMLDMQDQINRARTEFLNRIKAVIEESNRVAHTVSLSIGEISAAQAFDAWSRMAEEIVRLEGEKKWHQF